MKLHRIKGFGEMVFAKVTYVAKDDILQHIMDDNADVTQVSGRRYCVETPEDVAWDALHRGKCYYDIPDWRNSTIQMILDDIKNNRETFFFVEEIHIFLYDSEGKMLTIFDLDNIEDTLFAEGS